MAYVGPRTALVKTELSSVRVKRELSPARVKNELSPARVKLGVGLAEFRFLPSYDFHKK